MIEALVAIAVLVVGVMGVLGLFLYVSDSSREARQIHAATLVAEQSIAKFEMESRDWIGGAPPAAGTSLNKMYTSALGEFVDPIAEQLNAFGTPESALASNEPAPFCMRVQVTYRDPVMMSGGVRVFWAKASATRCDEVDPALFDLPRTRPQGYGFVTLPFAVRAYR